MTQELHSFDWQALRVVTYGHTGAYMTTAVRDLFEAEYHADMLRSGALIDPSLISSIHIQVECPVHGWQNAPWGFCEKCDDNALDALLDQWEAEGLYN